MRVMAALSGAVLLRSFTRYAIKKLAGQFIVGETSQDAIRNLTGLRREGLAFSIDILGEATINEEEARQYADAYQELLDALNDAQKGWSPLGGRAEEGNLDWNQAPRISVSLKPSSLYSQTRPEDFEGSVTGILKRLRAIYEKVIDVGGSLCIDMETYQHKGITLEVFRRLRLEYAAYPYLGIAIQSYLRDTDEDLSFHPWLDEGQRAALFDPARERRILGLRGGKGEAERLAHPGLHNQARDGCSL